MSVITISRGSYSRGKEIAEKVAKKLGYECFAREVLIEASSEFNVREVKLMHALEDPPSFFDRLTHKKEKYIAFIESALIQYLKKDNVVYHGLAGHYFIKGVPSVLKVRIIADLEDRINIVMKRDNVTRENAIQFLEKIDKQRQQWGEYLYGLNTTDPFLYDMVIHLRKISANDAVNIICNTVQLDQFKTTPESKKLMEDLYLASLVKVALIDMKHDITVTADDGVVIIRTPSLLVEEAKWRDKLGEAAQKVPGVEEARILFTMEEMESYD